MSCRAKRILAIAQRECASLPGIASIPGMTATALSAALNTSHRAMPNIMLAADEQADIITYILSLK